MTMPSKLQSDIDESAVGAGDGIADGSDETRSAAMCFLSPTSELFPHSSVSPVFLRLLQTLYSRAPLCYPETLSQISLPRAHDRGPILQLYWTLSHVCVRAVKLSLAFDLRAQPLER